jgi:hypothetical protein
VQTLGGDIAALVGILVLLLCIVQATRSRAQPRSPANAAAGSLLVTVLLIVALHVGAKVPYPAARTALYLLPMATLAVLLAAITWSAPARAVTLVGAVLLLLWYGVELHSRCFAYARYDAGAKPLFLAMQRDARLHFRRPVRVGGTWIYEPAVNFYRALYHAGWMLPMRRDYQKPEPSQYDYFLANADDYPQLQLSDYRLVAADPVSGTRLITRSE